MATRGTGKGLIADLVYSAMNPGTPQSVATLLNVVFVALGSILALMLFLGGFNIHLCVMLGLDLVLIFLVNFLLTELARVRDANPAVADGAADGATSTDAAAGTAVAAAAAAPQSDAAATAAPAAATRKEPRSKKRD
eukprot:c8173_g1_i1.p2 GENE.c8173_g1_i1~~c8173_g1_i1.p2  ORF type:complete len:137 (+),score=16.21 c8173_g1_i1:72-482(+)